MNNLHLNTLLNLKSVLFLVVDSKLFKPKICHYRNTIFSAWFPCSSAEFAFCGDLVILIVVLGFVLPDYSIRFFNKWRVERKKKETRRLLEDVMVEAVYDVEG